MLSETDRTSLSDILANIDLAESFAEDTRQAIKRRDRGGESLADIGRSYDVSAGMISRLTT